MITRDFKKALIDSEVKANYDLNDKWCVAIRYGVFGSFPLSYAIDRDYAIVCITIY